MADLIELTSLAHGRVFRGISSGNPTGTPFVSSNGLVLAYDMETLTGGLMDDFSPEGNDGTITGTTDVAGKFGRARDFVNANSDRITVPAFALSGTVITLSVWMRSSQRAFPQTVVSDAAQSATVGYIWTYRQINTDDLMWEYATGSAIGTATSGNFFAGFDGLWVHVGIVADYSAATVTFYRNGVLFSSSAMTTPLFPSASRVRYVGAYSPTQHFMDGIIDEPLIFSRALSDAEIRALSGRLVPYVNLTSHHNDIIDLTSIA